MKKQKKKTEVNNEMIQSQDNDNKALEDLTRAMYEYEQTTGNRITNVVIDTKPIHDSDCESEIHNCDDCEVCDQFADDPISKYDDELNPVDEIINDIGRRSAAFADESKELVNKCIADPIRRLFPVSTNTAETEEYEYKYNNDNLRYVLADKRGHDRAIAAAVGQIAEATAAMILEYQTQSISRAIGDGGVLQYESIDENGGKLFNPYKKDN